MPVVLHVDGPEACPALRQTEGQAVDDLVEVNIAPLCQFVVLRSIEIDCKLKRTISPKSFLYFLGLGFCIRAFECFFRVS